MNWRNETKSFFPECLQTSDSDKSAGLRNENAGQPRIFEVCICPLFAMAQLEYSGTRFPISGAAGKHCAEIRLKDRQNGSCKSPDPSLSTERNTPYLMSVIKQRPSSQPHITNLPLQTCNSPALFSEYQPIQIRQQLYIKREILLTSAPSSSRLATSPGRKPACSSIFLSSASFAL